MYYYPVPGCISRLSSKDAGVILRFKSLILFLEHFLEAKDFY